MTRRAAFADTYSVPRGTMAKFDLYAEVLVAWQSRMNLIGRSTLPDIWDRHFADSAQLAALADPSTAERVWLDLGSGAGFPSLVLALLRPGCFHLVEATTKKCLFLEAVASATGLDDRVRVHNVRIEALPKLAADIITARACAGLIQLFDWGYDHGRQAQWLLMKGRSAEPELASARTAFDFAADLIPSRTDPEARIVVARDVVRRRTR